eukprot:304665-Rhodomonas_salina.1
MWHVSSYAISYARAPRCPVLMARIVQPAARGSVGIIRFAGQVHMVPSYAFPTPCPVLTY